MQIEQFIESMFPSQDPKAIAAMQAAQAPAVRPEEAEQRAMAEEAKWDTSKWLLSPHLSSRKGTADSNTSLPPGNSNGLPIRALHNHGKTPLSSHTTVLLIADATRIDRYRMALWRPLRYRYQRVEEG